MASDNGMMKTLGIVALSATASSLITYTVFKWHQRKQQMGGQGTIRAGELLTPVRSAPPSSSAHGDELQSMRSLGSHPRGAADPFDHRPRQGYLSWDDYFMAVAFLSAQRSKDPNKQVGACIVDRTNIICGIGYNGFPRGCPDSELPWAKRSRDGDPLETKYPYVCHAEMNAILNKNGASVAGARVYVTMFPCNECAKLMIQAGIAEIVYHEDKAQPRAETPAPGSFKLSQQYAASKKLLSLAGVKLRQHLFKRSVTITLSNHPAHPLLEGPLAWENEDRPSSAASGAAAAAAALLDGDGMASAGTHGGLDTEYASAVGNMGSNSYNQGSGVQERAGESEEEDVDDVASAVNKLVGGGANGKVVEVPGKTLSFDDV